MEDLPYVLRQDDESVAIHHHRDVQALATEMFKVENNLSPQIIQEMFQFRTNRPNIRTDNVFWTPGINTLRYLDPKIWNIVPKTLKDTL